MKKEPLYRPKHLEKLSALLAEKIKQKDKEKGLFHNFKKVFK